MSLAADTRAAVRADPVLLEALRAGVVNYAAAARALDVSDDVEAVATALRRFAADLPPRERTDAAARVTMHSGLARTAGDGGIVAVSGTGFVADDGPHTGVVATGAVDGRALAHVLGRLDAAEVAVDAAGVADDALAVVVSRRDGPDALRVVEDALGAVPR